ncbi:unannotated protein [freshwater metagenome]|uniref:Unannotated protein n=1 Tax=freshwater metagenome TaxID=449393 RepID=A0A6J6I5T9_9ZZZZ
MGSGARSVGRGASQETSVPSETAREMTFRGESGFGDGVVAISPESGALPASPGVSAAAGTTTAADTTMRTATPSARKRRHRTGNGRLRRNASDPPPVIEYPVCSARRGPGPTSRTAKSYQIATCAKPQGIDFLAHRHNPTRPSGDRPQRFPAMMFFQEARSRSSAGRPTRVTRSTSGDSARRAPAVHCSRVRFTNGSK